MLILVSILVGIICFTSFSYLLWHAVMHPTRWLRFTEKEEAFWIKRGLPVKWAGTIKQADQGWLVKVILTLCIILALVLIVAAIAQPLLFYRHG